MSQVKIASLIFKFGSKLNFKDSLVNSLIDPVEVISIFWSRNLFCNASDSNLTKAFWDFIMLLLA